jgi:hypothetical protein
VSALIPCDAHLRTTAGVSRMLYLAPVAEGSTSACSSMIFVALAYARCEDLESLNDSDRRDEGTFDDEDQPPRISSIVCRYDSIEMAAPARVATRLDANQKPQTSTGCLFGQSLGKVPQNGTQSGAGPDQRSAERFPN